MLVDDSRIGSWVPLLFCRGFDHTIVTTGFARFKLLCLQVGEVSQRKLDKVLVYGQDDSNNQLRMMTMVATVLLTSGTALATELKPAEYSNLGDSGLAWLQNCTRRAELDRIPAVIIAP